jgi:hypothetical protein
MIKTIKEKPPEQVRGRPFPRSGGLATFEPLNLQRELPSQTRWRTSGPAYGRHMTPPGTLPPLPAGSLSGPFRLPAGLPEGRPATGP